MNYAKLFKRYIVLNSKEFVEFKEAFILGLFAQILLFIVNFMFWGTIYNYTNSINGWTFGQILMLQGFFNVFQVFLWVFFRFAEHIDFLIVRGKLDALLSKPVNPMIAYMFQRMSLFSLVRVITAVIYFYAAVQFGASISLLNFAGAVVMTFLGCCIFALILTAIGLLSFWIGRTESMSAIFDSMWELGGYPLTVFPLAAQLLLTFGLPVIFLQTYPALFTMQQMDVSSFLQLVAVEMILIAVWFGITLFVWKKGLKRYSSYGG
jgi:ABC-2 type transport system permease protein